MKLFTRYNRINVIASILIFLIGCVAFYFVISYVLVRQLDKTLHNEQTEILQYSKEHNALPEILNTTDQQIVFEPTTKLLQKPKYASYKLWDEKDKDMEWVRNLTFTVNLSDKIFKVTVTKSQMETEDLLTLILYVAISMVALIIIANFIINRMVLQKLWQPFYATIGSIEQYQLSKKTATQLPDTTVDEFNLLNNSFNSMAKKVEHEYEMLKEFTGNAAHEMQTPLAVISNNIEALMQDELVLKNQHQVIAIIEQSVSRLSRLNQSLLLLTKIENHRFELNEVVKWDTLLTQKLAELAELLTAQKLQITIDTIPVTTLFHHHLADIIISNLLNNAIRYNVANGSISIQLHINQLTISNTSLMPSLDTEKIGSRFYRHSATKPDGNGLGLSIIKQICDVAGYQFIYTYEQSQHHFAIVF
jgi:signal transduction histidine kinase